ncbi:ATF4 family protein [Megaselia abdita]
MYNKSFTLDCLFKKEELDDPSYFEYNNYNQYDYLRHWFPYPTIKKEEEQWTDSYGIQNEQQSHHSDNASSNAFYYQQNGFTFDAMEKFHYQQQQQQLQQHQTNELTQITPPQTPPMVHIKDDYIIQNLISQHDQQFQQQQQEAYDFNQLVAAASQTVLPALSPVTSEYIEYSSDVSHASPLSISDDDVARETQIVDDIVRSRAQDLPDNWNDEEDDASLMDDDSSWEPASPSFDGNSSIGSPSSGGKISSKSSSNGDKKRTRPYGRGPEERKSRKKEQNKNAATRYRQKKKEEMKHILDEESVLVDKHDELAKKVSDFENEVKYLKKLIREFYKNK